MHKMIDLYCENLVGRIFKNKEELIKEFNELNEYIHVDMIDMKTYIWLEFNNKDKTECIVENINYRDKGHYIIIEGDENV